MPWTHWFDSGNAGAFINSLGSTPEKGSACDPHNVLHDELFTRSGGVAFGLLVGGITLAKLLNC